MNACLIRIFGVFLLLNLIGCSPVNNSSWDPRETLPLETKIGESRSDFLFKSKYCLSTLLNYDIENSPKLSLLECNLGTNENYIGTIEFDDNDVIQLMSFSTEKLGIFNDKIIDEDSLYKIFGNPDVIETSKGMRGRIYTYFDLGFQFELIRNTPTSFTIFSEKMYPRLPDVLEIGGDRLGGISKVVAFEQTICPSEKCHYLEDGSLKEEFKKSDYSLFLNNRSQ